MPGKAMRRRPRTGKPVRRRPRSLEAKRIYFIFSVFFIAGVYFR